MTNARISFALAFGFALLAPVVLPRTAAAQATPSDEPAGIANPDAGSPSTTSTPAAASDAGTPGAPGAPPTTPPAVPEGPPHAAVITPPRETKTPAIAPETPRLLAPRYPEDFYPAMAPEPGILQGIPAATEDPKALRFALHGYFRAPLRITRTERPAGSTKPNEGDWNWHTPYLIDDDYYRSGFAYTPVNETDYAELYLSVGNDKVTATVGVQGTLFSDAARPLIDRQPGISQGWVTYRSDLHFMPIKTRLRVKAGAFWDRFGHLPKYDTYIFGRTHQMGEQVRFEFEHDDLTFWALHGLGTHLEDISANQGLTLLNYGSVGASYKQAIELGGYILDARARDKRPLKELTDATVSIVGVDLRADTRYAGKIYGATSYISADQATYQAPVVEVMHSYGGRGLTENYFGTQSSENGTGSLWNVGLQWDFSLADTSRAMTGDKASPLPWNGDVTASLFGLYSFIQSKQASPDPLVNRDDKKAFKWGAEAGYRITEWVGLSCRYDRVILDVDDSANSFRILSPRLSFFTSLVTRELIFLQYSRYMYNERIRLRPGQVQLETFPNDHVVKIQAQMTF
jgi:hypothetical protein